MLKSLVFIFLSGMAFSTYAQSSNYDRCVSSLEYYFLASRSEATTVCRQDSSPDFMRCMVNRGETTTQHVLDAAPICSRAKVKIPADKPDDASYNNFKSCPGNLQANARMGRSRAHQICEWDSSDLMQNCLVSLVKKARFHNEHAIQYCGFANVEYRNKIPQFVACVIDNAQQGYDVYSNVMKCDDEMIYGRRVSKPRPNPRDQQTPVQNPEVKPRPDDKSGKSSDRKSGKKSDQDKKRNQEQPVNDRHSDDRFDEPSDYTHEPTAGSSSGKSSSDRDRRSDRGWDQDSTSQDNNVGGGQSPETQDRDHTPVQPEKVESKPVDQSSTKNRSSGGRQVPTPVEIKIEESSNPEVNDQPINTESTSNSEALPM